MTVGATQLAGDPIRGAAAKLEITCLGHEGFLLRGGHRAVMLDGFLGLGESERDTLTRRVSAEMLAGRPPFDRINLALVSHPHSDHFDPMVAGRFLEKHAETILAAIPAVHASLRRDFPRYAAIQRRLVEIKWDRTGRATKVLNGIRVDCIKFAHEASQFYPDDVGLHVVHINGMNVLHAADAEMLHGELDSVHLEKESLDVAILPYSFLATPGAGKLFAEHVGAKRVIAMHLPAGGMQQAMAVVREQFPKALFLVTPFQSVRF